ncbi:MAG: hypothetical protein RDV48_01485 [Candidatus Eremiobacteraeota bacterium]|nr:hypothetical protein [Candidatus Eremiobacteraeota bacterium]
MWDKLRKQIRIEIEQLHNLIETHRSLIEKCRETPPSAIELSALAAMLHSFYTGIENLFKRVAIEIDEGPPHGEAWHRQLLDAMATLTQNRPAVLSAPLRELLREYLEFRHVFRHAYTFDLCWTKMAHLVLECENVLNQLEQEINGFIGMDESERKLN